MTTTDERHVMHTLGQDGDVRIMWDRDNLDEVATARQSFRDMTKPRSEGGRGYLAYKAEGRRGEQGEQIRDFDPDAERIILVAPNAGG